MINKVAVERYHSGASAQEVNEDLKKRFNATLAEGSIWRMYARTQRIDATTGNLFGYWACVPQWRPRKEGRRPPSATHYLSALFVEAPKVEAALCAFVLKRTTGPEMRPVSTIRPHMVWNVFLSECKKHTTREQEQRWPFSGSRCGYEAIRRWHKEERYKNPSAAARNELPLDLAKQVASDYKSTKSIAVPSAHISLAYSETQLDEFHMDHMSLMLVPGSEPGEFLEVKVGRQWALCMVECASTAVLSSGVAFGNSYTTADVLRLIHSALVPPGRPERLRLQDPEWRYRDDAAYPAELPDFARNSWMTLAIDRHSTHLAALADAMTVTRCEVVQGQPGRPQLRRVIEAYFASLAKRSEWFESAVGNNPRSPARRDPEGGARASVVFAPLSLEYLDIQCRNYNATPQVALDGNSPLGRLALLASQGKVYRSPVGEFGAGNLYRLLPRYEAELSRRHSKTLGPLCIYFGYSCYVGPELSSAQELMLGATTAVDIYPQEDARFAFVVPRAFPERVYRVVCTGRWRLTPHTLTERLFSSRAAKKKVFADAAGGPLLGVGLARALAHAATSSEGLAKLLSGTTAFMDRHGAGVVPYIDMKPAQLDELLEFANKQPDELDIRGWLPSDRHAESDGFAPPTVPPEDKFGLLGGQE